MNQAECHGEKRSRKQEQFIAALLSYPTVEAAAKAVGMGRVTAWRLRKDPAFAQRYREATRDAMRHAAAQLQGAAREKFLRQVEFKAIIRRSAIYNFVIEDLLRRYVYYRMRHMLMAGTLDAVGGMDNLDVNAVNASLQESLDETRAHNAQLVLLVLASKDQQPNDLHPFQKAMLDFAAANHVPVVNMVDELSKNAPPNF